MTLKEFKEALKENVEKVKDKDMGTFDLEIDVFKEHVLDFEVEIDIRNAIIEARKSDDIFETINNEIMITSGNPHSQDDFDEVFKVVNTIIEAAVEVIQGGM